MKMEFKLNKESSREDLKVFECKLDKTRLTIIQSTTVSVFARREVHEWNSYLWYIEISNHTAKNFTEAKRLAKKMYEIVLWYNVIQLWKGQ